jgi:hypothetical protein
MLARFRAELRSPSPAFIIAMLALFVALGGTSVAAIGLSRGSVKGKFIAKNAITSPKVKNHSLKKSDFAAKQLPAGPRGLKGDKGDKGDAGQVPAPGPMHFVGAQGEIQFWNGGGNDCLWGNADPAKSPALYYKDLAGVVHLQGLVKATPGPDGDMACTLVGGSGEDIRIFFLPEGFRPVDPNKRLVFSEAAAGTSVLVNVDGNGTVSLDPNSGSNSNNAATSLTLDGISFRADP